MSTAEDKARALLLSHLTEQQKADFDRYGYFEVIGRSGRHYRVGDWSYRNPGILELRKGKPIFDYIIYPKGSQYLLPSCDTILVRKLLLETNDFKVRLMACSSAIYNRDGWKHAPWWRQDGNPVMNAIILLPFVLGAAAVTLLIIGAVDVILRLTK